MEKWLYMVQSVCADPSKEQEFQEWYDTIHVPDLLKAPGFIRATRYVNKEPAEGEGNYLAIYEIETEDIDKLWEAYQAYIQQLRDRGRVVPYLKVVSRTRWRQLG